MKKNIAPLVEILTARQRECGLSDAEFALNLGISTTTWRFTRTGLIPVGLSLLKGVKEEYFDLDDEILEAIRQYAPNSKERVTA